MLSQPLKGPTMDPLVIALAIIFLMLVVGLVALAIRSKGSAGGEAKIGPFSFGVRGGARAGASIENSESTAGSATVRASDGDAAMREVRAYGDLTAESGKDATDPKV